MAGSVFYYPGSHNTHLKLFEKLSESFDRISESFDKMSLGLDKEVLWKLLHLL